MNANNPNGGITMSHNISALILCLSLSMGCAFHAGTITPKSEGAQTCKDVYISFGNTVGPCGMEGGGISLPGSALVAGVFEAAGKFASGMFGNAPIVINHTAPSAPVEP